MKVGVLGTGFIVNEFTGNFLKHKDYELIGIWGRNLEKAKAIPGYQYYTDDLDVLLNDENIDTIYVGLPNALHYEYGMKALKAHKDVIMEKPFTVTAKQAQQLFKTAEENGCVIIEAIMTRYQKNYKKIKEELSKLGDIKMIDINYSQYSRRYDRFKRGDIAPAFNPKLAGGALLDLNVYSIHFVAGLFGMPKDLQYFPNMEGGVDTSGVLIMDYGTFKARLNVGKDCKVDCRVVIQGDKGYLKMDSAPSRCAGYAIVLNNGEKYEVTGEDGEFIGIGQELDALADYFKDKDEALSKEYVDETMLVMEILEASLKSADINY